MNRRALLAGLVTLFARCAYARAPRRVVIPYSEFVDPRPRHPFIAMPLNAIVFIGDIVALVPGVEAYATRLPRDYVVMDVVSGGPSWKILALAPLSAK